MLKCMHCGHEWQPRVAGLPKECPNCRRYHWNRPLKKVTNIKVITNNKEIKERAFTPPEF